MSRQIVRDLKRVLSAGSRDSAELEARLLAAESALALLARSIRFGHRRLAVLRLVVAVRAGAKVSQEQWDYCRDVACPSKGPALQALLDEALNLERAETAC